MITRENITVPANIRTEFDTSKINTEINTIEEALKDQQVLGDDPYIPTPDERTLNVVQRIKETSTYYKNESASNAGFTNVWEYKEGITPSVSNGGTPIYIIVEDITDPSLLLGATLINSDGVEYSVTEIPKDDDGIYFLGNFETSFLGVAIKETELGSVMIPAGLFTCDYDGGNTTIVKIIATSDIFPVE